MNKSFLPLFETAIAIMLPLVVMADAASDYKKCVVSKIQTYLAAENSCFTEHLNKSVNKVSPAYASCAQEILNNLKDSPDNSLIDVISHAKYDEEIQNMINAKIQSCGLNGSAKIKDKGLSRSIKLLEVESDSGKGSGKKPPGVQ